MRPLLQSADYVSHTVDGMPQCRHCGIIFTRVEALKKHLRRSCPTLHAPDIPYTPSCPTVAADCAETAAPPDVSVFEAATPAANKAAPIGPLIAQPDFRAQLKQGWKTVLRSAAYRASLSTYCVYCGQWLDSDGVKQHHRLVHADAWAHKYEACARCNGLSLVVTSPCHYCNRTVKCPRTHIRRCPVLFQASVAELTCRHQDSSCKDGGWPVRGGSGDHGSPGDERRSWPGSQRASSQSWATWLGRDGGGKRKAQQVAEAAVSEGQLRERSSGLGQLEFTSGRLVPGTRLGAGSENPGPLDSASTPCHPARGGTIEDQDRHDLHVLPGHGSGRDTAAGQEGRDTMAGEVRGETSEITSGDNPSTEYLRGSAHEDRPTPGGHCSASEGQGLGMDPRRVNGPDPLWTYFQWNPEARKQEPSAQPAIKNSEVQTHLKHLQVRLAEPGVLTLFKATRPMSSTDRYASAVLPFICTLSLRSQVATQSHAAIAALVNNSALKLIGARIRPARGERQPLSDQLEKAYLAVPWTEWRERRPAWTREPATQPDKESLTAPGTASEMMRLLLQSVCGLILSLLYRLHC